MKMTRWGMVVGVVCVIQAALISRGWAEGRSRTWDFENDKADRPPKGWVLQRATGDFSAKVRQEEGNQYLHLEAHEGEATPGISAIWGRGTPSHDWVSSGAVQFRIRFNAPCRLSYLRLSGNVPASGPDNDSNQLLFMTFQPSGSDGESISPGGQPPAATFELGKWTTVRIDFQGATGRLAKGDGKPHGTWKLTVEGRTVSGEFDKTNADLPFGCALNSISFGQWFNTPVDFDVDDIRVTGAGETKAETAVKPAGGATVDPRFVDAKAGPAAVRLVSLVVDGVTYENVRFGPVTGDRVVLFHNHGLANVSVQKLPEEVRERLTAPAQPESLANQAAREASAAPASPRKSARAEPSAPETIPSVRDLAPNPTRVYTQLGAVGEVRVLIGFIRSRITVDEYGRPASVVLIELARRSDPTKSVPANMELRPSLWMGTGEQVLLKNWKSTRDVGELIRVRVSEMQSLKDYRTFVVTGEY